MKRVSNIWLCVCACVLLIGTYAPARAQNPGETCYKAIPLGKDFHVEVTEPKTVWYTAWTYDLPLSVYFIPQNESDPAPEVMMDFGCTPGIYADPILCLLFCKGGTMAKEIPNYPKLETTTVEGKKAYYLSMGKKYRDLLLKMGIDYNVQVFVKVTYKSGGNMSIAPDDMFSNCMDSVKFMHLGDTIQVQALDTKRHVIVPYVQWKNENVVYSWEGEQPCRFIVTSDCRSDVFGSDGSILDIQNLTNGQAYTVSKKDIQYYVDFEENQAGMFFVKWYSEAPGVLTITKEPVPDPLGGATLLYYDQEQMLLANDTDALYAISTDWDEATKFTVPTDHIFRMYIGATPDFTPSNALFSYTFDRSISGGHELTLDKATMTNIWKKKLKTDHYMYVRFSCTARTNITATLWTPSACTTKSTLVQKNDSLVLRNPQYYADYYRFRYVDWVGADMVFTWWIKAANCDVAIGDSCEFNMQNGADHVRYFFTAPKRKANGTVTPFTVPAEDVALWKDYVDEDGFLYIRFNSVRYAGGMTVKSNAPSETDPVYPASTVAIVCDEHNSSKWYVSVSESQHITIKDVSDALVTEWDAVVGESHELNLPAGMYLLQGAREKIALNL